MRARLISTSLLLWAMLGFPQPFRATHPSIVAAAEAVRPEIGKPLQAASGLLKAQKFKDALAKLKEADAVGNKTPYESFMIERMRASALAGLGDHAAAAKSFEALVESGRLSSAEKLQMMEAVVGSYYRAKDFGKTATWANRYAKEGGTNPQITGLASALKFQSGDYAGAARDLAAQVAADEKAGRRPTESTLQTLANAQQRTKNDAGYLDALMKLVQYYPKPAYWAQVIDRVTRKSGFADRLAVDVFRLRLATGNMRDARDYMELAQLVMQDGNNAEGKKVIDAGYAAKQLGVGPEAERHGRLKKLVETRLAGDAAALAQAEKDANAAANGDELVKLGLNFVTAGQSAKGLALMEQGVKKGNLRRPEDAKLRLGVAYVLAGQRAKALAMLRQVGGDDGTAELARLWALHAQSR